MVEKEELRLAELLVGLSLVADVGMGLEPGESARACLIAGRLADALGAPDPSAVYYTTLLQHVGCTAYAHEAAALLGGDEIAVKRAAVRTDFDRPREVLTSYLPALAPDASVLARLRAAGVAATHSRQIVEGYSRANCEVAALTARRVGLGEGVSQGLHDAYETWNGRGGPRGVAGEEIALEARLAQVAAVGGLFDVVGGVDAAVGAVSARAGTSLDPAVCAAFCSSAASVLAELAAADVLRACVESEPAPAVRVSGDGIDTVCRAFGEAVDLKSPYHHGHSVGVAVLAAAAAERLGLDVVALRRAALLHDIGRAAVPNGVWEKPGPLTSGDWERVRLHAYQSERILSRCGGPLEACAPVAGMHHERLDGSGYHRAVAGALAIGMPARVLAAADAFQAATQPRAFRPALSADAAASSVSADAAAGRLDADAVSAVVAAAGQRAPRAARPAGVDRPPGRGAAFAGARAVEPGDRALTGRVPADRRAPRAGHLRADRRVEPGRRGAVRDGARPPGVNRGRWTAGARLGPVGPAGPGGAVDPAGLDGPVDPVGPPGATGRAGVQAHEPRAPSGARAACPFRRASRVPLQAREPRAPSGARAPCPFRRASSVPLQTHCALAANGLSPRKTLCSKCPAAEKGDPLPAEDW